MFRWFRKKVRTPRPDPEAFLEHLNRFAFGEDLSEYQLQVQMQQDFQHVFGRDVQGKRALYQIFMWAGFYSKPDTSDPHGLAVNAGARDLCWNILAAMNAEIPPDPTIIEETDENED